MARVNRAIELLGQGQPVYYIATEESGFVGGVKDYNYEEGVKAARPGLTSSSSLWSIRHTTLPG